MEYTEPPYSNERYVSVSRKPLDGFQNAFNTKYIFRFEKGFVTTILLNSTIYSTLLINLSISVYCSFHFQIPIEMRAAAKPALPILPLLPLFSFLSF